MADRMALGVLNLDSYEISSGKSKEKKFYFHAAPAYSSLKNVNFYVEIESERERWLESIAKSTQGPTPLQRTT